MATPLGRPPGKRQRRLRDAVRPEPRRARRRAADAAPPVARPAPRASASRIAVLAAGNLAVLLLLLIGVEVGSCALIRAKNVLAPGSNSTFPPAYRHASHAGHEDWVPQYVADSRARVSEYRVGLWEPPEYASPTVNVRDGHRVSAADPGPGAARQAYAFGGSTLWGSGVRDEYTIPSHLNRLAGGAVRFVNYGVEGYATTQEVLKLSLLLAEGRIPDAVILYDGVNDSKNAWYQAPGYEMGWSQNAERLHAGTGTLLHTLFEKSQTFQIVWSLKRRLRRQEARSAGQYEPTPADRELVERATAIYLDNVRYVRRLGREFGFEVHAFLQPALRAGTEIEAGVVSDFERAVYTALPKRDRELTRSFYERVQASGEVIDLSRVLVEEGREGGYFDGVHLGPWANEVVARSMLAYVTE